jgi:hypothetical protein
MMASCLVVGGNNGRGGSGSGGAAGGSGGSGSSGGNGNAATSLQCFHAIVQKCQHELARIGDMIQTIQEKRRYPHTGFYQKNWGAVNQVNCRTIDLIRSVQNMNGVLRPDAMNDIYQANLRFQLAVQNIVLTRAMLSSALDEFIKRVADYEVLLRGGGGSGRGTSEDAVSSTTPDDDNKSALSSKLAEIQSNITVMQSFLNQSPMLSCPIRMELHLMDIYDNFDDSVAVHHLLTDENALNLLPSERQPIYHEWERIASEQVVKQKFIEISQNMRGNRSNSGTSVGR